MAFDLSVVRVRGPESAFEVTPASIAAYASAVGAPVSDVPPALYAALPLDEAVSPVLEALASLEERAHVVHLAHDLVVHRPLAAGDRVVTTATPAAVAPRSSGTVAVVRTLTLTQAGEPVNEQVLSLFFRGIRAEAAVGEKPPEPAEPPGQPAPMGAAKAVVFLADDLPERYAAASGDDFAIHLDDAFARSVGLEGRIVHGMCTLAIAACIVAGDRPLRRISTEFAAPVYPGGELTVTRWDGAFEAHSGGERVLRRGRFELV